MKPARSLAASVVALGFAGSVAAPQPAFAAPAPCERAENYAAQSGAELLRIDELEIRTGGEERPVTKAPSDEAPPAREGASDHVLTDPIDGSDEDNDTLSEGIGAVGRQLIDGVLPNNPILPPIDPVTGQPAVSGATRGVKSADTGGIGGGEPADTSDAGGGESADTGGMGGGELPRLPGRQGRGDAAPKTARLSLSDVGLGEARAAMVATATIKSAAVARILDGQADGEPAWTEPLLQQAPPTNGRPSTRTTPAGRVGPLKIGAGNLTGRARWDAAMACGNAAGETARAQSAVHGATLLGAAGTPLVRVREKAAGMSTTALEGSDGNARTVASATVAAGTFELAGGRVKLRVLKAPSLTATMSSEGGDVRYEPAAIEVSGDGIATKRLDTAGESADVTLGAERDATESGVLDAAGLGSLRPASRPLPLPHVPGLPTVNAPNPVSESAPATGGDTRLHITLGGERRAEKGHAIAARATAIEVSLTQGGADKDRGQSGYGGQTSAVKLNFAIGLLEAAAVAPEERLTPVDTSGAAGGLPITGPGVAGLAMGGAALLLSGIGALVLSVRRRRARA
jgi:hypothetical protein